MTASIVPLDAGGYARALGALGIDVSRETLERLERYLELIRRWQRAVNLVGATTLEDPWRRHFLDSAQLLRLLPTGQATLADLGSGAGLPGLVLAAHQPDLPITLVEADSRKSAFLLEARRSLSLPRVSVLTGRLEKIQAVPCSIVTARALAPLAQLLDWAAPWMGEDGICLFHKGRGYQDELTAARRRWKIDPDILPSLIAPDSVVLRISSANKLSRNVL